MLQNEAETVEIFWLVRSENLTQILLEVNISAKPQVLFSELDFNSISVQ